MQVLAEGVENLRQMEVLHRLGFRIMQGFLFSKPRPPEDIESWLQQTVLPKNLIHRAKPGGQIDAAVPVQSGDRERSFEVRQRADLDGLVLRIGRRTDRHETDRGRAPMHGA